MLVFFRKIKKAVDKNKSLQELIRRLKPLIVSLETTIQTTFGGSSRRLSKLQPY